MRPKDEIIFRHLLAKFNKKNKKSKCDLKKKSENQEFPPNFEPPSNESPNFEFFTEHSSIHGLRFLSKRRNNNFTRIFWSLSLVMSLIGLYYNGQRLYIKLNVSPDIGISIKQELSSQIPFPAITVCLNLFTKDGMANLTEYFEEYNKNGKKNVLKLTKTEKKYLAANAMRCGNNKLDPILECCKDANISNIVQLMDESFPTIDEVLTVCSVRLSFTDCKNLFQRILTHHGFCFTTNIQPFDTIFNEEKLNNDFKIYMKNLNDTDDTVHWTLDHGYKNDSVSDVVPLRLTKANVHALRVFSSIDDANNKCKSKNIMVILHLPNEIPTSFHRRYEFQPTHSEQLVLSAKVTQAHESLKHYSPKQRGCYFADEKKLHFFKVYTRSHCYLECFAEYVLEKCGCVAFYMPRNSSTEICDLDNGLCLHDCMYKWPVIDEMTDGKTPCECYPTCNNIEYIVQEIDTVYDASANSHVIKNYSSDILYSKLFVYFDDHIVQVNEKFVSYKLQNFIADIGGLLGLFLGCSLLSMIEVLYFICMAVKKKYENRKLSANYKIQKVTPANDKFLKNLDKIGDDTYIIRGPLYKRNRF